MGSCQSENAKRCLVDFDDVQQFCHTKIVIKRWYVHTKKKPIFSPDSKISPFFGHLGGSGREISVCSFFLKHFWAIQKIGTLFIWEGAAAKTMNSGKHDQSHWEIELSLITRQHWRDGKMFLFLKPPSSAFPLRKYYNTFSTCSICLRNTWLNSSCCCTQNVNLRRWIMRKLSVPLLVIVWSWFDGILWNANTSSFGLLPPSLFYHFSKVAGKVSYKLVSWITKDDAKLWLQEDKVTLRW